MSVETEIAAAVCRALEPQLSALRAEVTQLRAELERQLTGQPEAPATAPEMIYASPAQLATRFGVSLRTIRRLISDGTLPTLHAGSRVRIDVAAAERILSAKGAA